MGEHTEAFVGIDAAKARNAIAVAEGGRGGEVRYLGEVDASEPGMRRLVARLAAKYDRVHFCYGDRAAITARPATGCTGSSPASGTGARSSRRR